MLPIITSLVKHLQKQETNFSMEQESGKQTIEKFLFYLGSGIKGKVSIRPY